jgi:alkyl hydroperoxide reductase subunit AhpC
VAIASISGTTMCGPLLLDQRLSARGVGHRDDVCAMRDLMPGALDSDRRRSSRTPSRCSAMITSLPSSPLPSSMTRVAWARAEFQRNHRMPCDGESAILVDFVHSSKTAVPHGNFHKAKSTDHRRTKSLIIVGLPPCEANPRRTTMAIRLGDIAPDFEQDSSEGRISFHEWLGDSWGVLFSHPADFTPVCTTELGMTAKLKDEFAKRNVKIIALSVDPVESHKKWIEDINDTQKTKVNFPIIADADRKVSLLYDMIHPNASATQTVRSVFIIDPAKKVRPHADLPRVDRPQLRRDSAG